MMEYQQHQFIQQQPHLSIPHHWSPVRYVPHYMPFPAQSISNHHQHLQLQQQQEMMLIMNARNKFALFPHQQEAQYNGKSGSHVGNLKHIAIDVVKQQLSPLNGSTTQVKSESVCDGSNNKQKLLLNLNLYCNAGKLNNEQDVGANDIHQGIDATIKANDSIKENSTNTDELFKNTKKRMRNEKKVEESEQDEDYDPDYDEDCVVHGNIKSVSAKHKNKERKIGNEEGVVVKKSVKIYRSRIKEARLLIELSAMCNISPSATKPEILQGLIQAVKDRKALIEMHHNQTNQRSETLSKEDKAIASTKMENLQEKPKSSIDDLYKAIKELESGPIDYPNEMFEL